MEYEIAILITTFLRDNLLYKTILSIMNNYMGNHYIILIADQGYHSVEKDINIDYFDSGLSYARNFLVKKAAELNIPYCLLLADSIQFIQRNDFGKYISFLKSDESYGIVGFELENSKCSWEYDLSVDTKGIHLFKPDENFPKKRS